ncbi:MAG TPA: AAA family ATPase [Candidatus Saccharimonadales bacterium]|nr:AAA family ATPase [Candidatus Saccharimonadales bacterium]
MDALILHDHTKEQVAQFLKQPSHAALLIGSNGIGKTCLAANIAEQILGLAAGTLPDYPYFKMVSPEKDSISIDAIRELQKFLQLKTIGKRPLRRVVILEHAEGLTIEAQNAFLKLLEEPPADTVMILTVDTVRALLPTIRSRVQTLPVSTPNETALRDFFKPMAKDDAALNQAYFLSGGLPGLMTALLSGDTDHPLLAGVAEAKLILQKQAFERLALVEGMSKQKEASKYTLQALQHIAQTGIDQAAKKGDAAKLKQWHKVLKTSSSALDSLANNANPKLVLSNLMLNI